MYQLITSPQNARPARPLAMVLEGLGVFAHRTNSVEERFWSGALITSATIEVIGLFVIVTRYLFPSTTPRVKR